VKQKNIDLPMAEIEAFCQRWKITELSLFGSVLRDDFRPNSDVDVLVTFAEDARWGLFEIFDAQEELAQILGRKVDLVERQAVEESPNYIRRKHILSTVQPVYVAR
jgi:predicted nucleotidyltransferase